MGGSNGKEVLKPQTLREKSRELFLSEEEVLRCCYLFWAVSEAGTGEAVRGAVQQCARRQEHYDPPCERTEFDLRLWRGASDGFRPMRAEQFLSMPAFRHNPFSPRIFSCFAEDNTLTLTSFCLLVSTLSRNAPPEVKHCLAFKLFDFDDDGAISRSDVASLLDIYKDTATLWVPLTVSGTAGALVQAWSDVLPTCSVAKQEKGAVEVEAVVVPGDAGRMGGASGSRVGVDVVERLFTALDIDGSDELSESDFERVLQQIPEFCAKFSVGILEQR